jgi:hypothetical protein
MELDRLTWHNRIETLIVPHDDSCIGEGSVATLADGREMQVQFLRKGDIVKGLEGVSKIVCVLKIIFPDQKKRLLRIDGNLSLTSEHPVCVSGVWTTPGKIQNTRSRKSEAECSSIYDFVVEEPCDRTMMFGKNAVACFGRGPHPFYGTQKVIEEMKKLPGWKEGLITLLPGAVIAKDGVSCGFDSNKCV